MSVRVFIVSDVAILREGLAEALARRGVEVVGAAVAAADALDELVPLGTDVVLVDVVSGAAIATVRRLAVECAPARVVAIAVPEVEREVIALAEAGVAGYVTLQDDIDRLVAVVERAARNEAVCSPRMTATLLRRVATLAAERQLHGVRASLTTRELEIAGLLRAGLSNKEISRQLSIELSTVKNHVHNVLEKLGVDRRTDVAWAAADLPLPRGPAARRAPLGA